MTILDTISTGRPISSGRFAFDDSPPAGWQQAFQSPVCDARRPARVGSTRPVGARPAGAPLQYRGTGIGVSRAVHVRRPVSTAVTVGVAAMTALITLWLGSLANFSGERAPAPAAVPDRLAVVQVQAGETLQQLAGRVAPDVPVTQIVDRIRDLNHLDSVEVDTGQTLIAPVA